jgi:hypothetical protein
MRTEYRGNAKVSEGELVVRMRGIEYYTAGLGGHLHQSSCTINAAKTRLRA